ESSRPGRTAGGGYRSLRGVMDAVGWAKLGAGKVGRVAMVIRVLLAAGAILAALALARAQAPAEVTIGYLHRPPANSAISLLEVPAGNDGLAGAALAIDDNNTTGRFLNQRYALAPVELNEAGE